MSWAAVNWSLLSWTLDHAHLHLALTDFSLAPLLLIDFVNNKSSNSDSLRLTFT